MKSIVRCLFAILVPFAFLACSGPKDQSSTEVKRAFRAKDRMDAIAAELKNTYHVYFSNSNYTNSELNKLNDERLQYVKTLVDEYIAKGKILLGSYLDAEVNKKAALQQVLDDAKNVSDNIQARLAKSAP